MALRDWVRLPSGWIQAGGLRDLRWTREEGSANTAALMALATIAHHAEDETGVARLTYNQFDLALGVSRTSISRGLLRLEELRVIVRDVEGRSTYQLANYDRQADWCKLPAKRLYSGGAIMAFEDFHLRSMSELHALKLYFLFAARRGQDTNMANLSFDKIVDYSGIERHRIKTGLSRLVVAGLIHVERLPSENYRRGVANAYRLTYLDTNVHLGTRGRGMERADFAE